MGSNTYSWKEEAIATLIDAIKEEYRKGTFTDSGLKPQGWDSIQAYLKANNFTPAKDQIQSKYKQVQRITFLR